MKKSRYIDLIEIFMLLLLISLILADTPVDDSLCEDIADAECTDGYIPVCYQEDNGDYYYICEYDTSQDCSDDPSYNLDCSKWCNNGEIIDYSVDLCCPPLYPYYHAGSCYSTMPFEDTDNYYTRHSNCFPTCRGTGPNPAPVPDSCKPEQCIDKRLQRCETGDGWSFNYENIGFVKGKCDVECLEDSDCPKSISYIYCNDSNIINNSKEYSCSENSCMEEQSETIFEECNYKCKTIDGQAICITQPSVCGNGVCELDETTTSCPADCKQPTPDNTFLYVIIGGIGVGGVIYYIKKRKGGKNGK